MIELLETGAAINSLSSSDTGWDLHLHMPEEPLAFLPEMILSQAKRGWKLGGRIVHVQVKSMKLSGYPSLNRGTVDGWIAGSKVGVPTFVLMLTAKGIQFADVADLVRYVDGPTAKPGKVKLSSIRRRPFHKVTFSAIAHLYLTYPALMSTRGGEINEVLWSKPQSAAGAEAIRALVIALVDGHAASTAILRGGPDSDDRQKRVGDVAFCLSQDEGWVDANRNLMLESLSEPDFAEGIEPVLYQLPRSRGADDDLSELLTLIVQIREKIANVEKS